MRGQGALEYMLIFAAFLAIFASVTQSQMIGPSRDLAGVTEKLSEAKDSTNKIASAINTVYNNRGSRTMEFVSFSGIENLEITEDNVRVVVFCDEDRIDISSNLEYGFEGSILDVPDGSYTVVAEWDSSEPEGIWLVQENNEIRINIRPGGE